MSALLTTLNPGLVLLFAGLVGLVLPIQRLRQGLMIAAPLIGIAMLAGAQLDVDLMTAKAIGVELILYRVDTLNYVFGHAFLIAALLNAIYALHNDDRLHDGMAMALAGSAVTATFAGDLMTLFIFWELTALGSVFLILKAGTRAAYFASMRYIAIQILSGVLLLDGIAYVYKYTGSLSLEAFADLAAPGAIFIFLAIAIKAAFPLLHNWLQDAYAKATVTGAAVLSAYVTTLAVLACARLFPGLDHLVWLGAIMVVFPVFFAVLENDLRRVLAYALNIQVGFMICAVGFADVATDVGRLALSGAAAHAFTSVIFMALLFMAMGAVLYRTGTAKASALGGLYKSMPFTTVFCLVGAASMSAVPLFSGFVSRSLIVDTAALTGNQVIWMMLLFGSAGVFA
ncbi:MAG: proton-conducting transporter membrane subunit, partial [Pseudomonadota bacterium]